MYLTITRSNHSNILQSNLKNTAVPIYPISDYNLISNLKTMQSQSNTHDHNLIRQSIQPSQQHTTKHYSNFYFAAKIANHWNVNTTQTIKNQSNSYVTTKINFRIKIKQRRTQNEEKKSQFPNSNLRSSKDKGQVLHHHRRSSNKQK